MLHNAYLAKTKQDIRLLRMPCNTQWCTRHEVIACLAFPADSARQYRGTGKPKLSSAPTCTVRVLQWTR